MLASYSETLWDKGKTLVSNYLKGGSTTSPSATNVVVPSAEPPKSFISKYWPYVLGAVGVGAIGLIVAKRAR